MTKENVVIVIPTFFRENEADSNSDDSPFDHPTTVEETTLEQCLNSLSEMETDIPFKIAILWSEGNYKNLKLIEDKINDLKEKYAQKLHIGGIGISDLDFLKETIEKYGIVADFIGFESYANIRNLQIFVSAILEADCIIGVDDDEIVKPDFLNKALEGAKVDGVAGLYLNSDDDDDWKLNLQRHDSHGDILYNKSRLMNQQHEYLYAQKGRLVKTPEVFGGCMVFGKEMYQNIPFDPYITRGEDIDYLMNALAMGYNWFLDKELHIIHLPLTNLSSNPEKRAYSVLYQDTIRFLYQKEKIELLSNLFNGKVSVDDLGIYPGEILKSNLKEKVTEYLETLEIPSHLKKHFPDVKEWVNLGVNRIKFIGNLFYLMKHWHFITNTIAKDQKLQNYVNKKFN
jgi:hypothetical protein